MTPNNHMGIPRWIPETDRRNELSTEKFTRKFAEKQTDRHPLELLVREVAQNSIDARPSGENAVRIEFSIDDRHGAAWEALAGGEGGRPGGGPVAVLTVSDRGTVGLRGPAERTGSAASEPEKNNYLNFISITSSSGKSSVAGGSYSLGRSLTYLLSRSMTVLVDTVYADERGKLMRRIVGMRLLDAEKLKDLNRRLGNSPAAAGPVRWCYDENLHPVQGELSDPSSQVNIAARQLGLEDSFVDGETGTDLHIVDFHLDDEGGDSHARIAKLLHAAAACNLYQAICATDERPATITSVTCRGGGQTLKLDGKALDPQDGAADLWPVHHMVRAYLEAQTSDGIASGHLGSQPTRHAAALPEISEMQPFRNLKEQGKDILDPACEDGISFIVASREPTRIVLDIWQKQPNHSEKWELEPRHGFWTVGCIVVVDAETCSKLRDAEDEAHTQWQKRGKNIGKHLGKVHRRAAIMAEGMGVKKSEAPRSAGSRELTKLGVAIGGAFTPPGKGPSTSTTEPGPSGPGGGGGIRPSSYTLVEKEGRVYHQYVYDGLVPGAHYTAEASEYNLAQKKRPGSGKTVLDSHMNPCPRFTATGNTQTILVEREDMVSITLKVERA